MRIVAAFDGSASSRAALQVAVDEAAGRGTPLHIVTAVDIAATMPVRFTPYLDKARQALLGAAAGAEDLLGTDRVTAAVQVGPAPAIVLRACRLDDLLVVGSHGHRPVARMLLGSTSTAVAAHAHCPVLVVKGPRPRPDDPVIVGVDGSEASAAAVRLAADEADRHGVALRAVFAVPPVVDPMGFVSGPDDPALQEAQAVLGESLAGLRESYPDLTVEPLVVQTHPVEALLRHARDARLVVVGTRGRGGLRSMLLGSVSREVLQRAQCLVAVVHPGRVAAADSDPQRSSRASV